MLQSDIISGTKVIIGLPVEDEREGVQRILENNGFHDIEAADNALDMVLLAKKRGETTSGGQTVLICDYDIGVLDLKASLDFAESLDPGTTVAVISDTWENEESKPKDDLSECVDVFLTRPIAERALIPALSLDLARKRHMLELEREFRESEKSFAKEKKMGFAKHLIMDKLGLSEESASQYILSEGKKYGYEAGDVAGTIYEVLLSGDKGN